MGSNQWAEPGFQEVIDFQEGPGILAKDFRDNGVPLVRLSGLSDGKSVLHGCDYLDPEMVRSKWSHFALQAGDILLSTSASLGRIAVVGPEAVGAIAYTGIIRMRPRDSRLFAPFIRYLLESPTFQQQAEIAGVGSVIRHFGPMHLRQMTVRLPPVEIQRAITHVLGTLDDKIELNRRMNKTLEEIAQAIFKSWFVDFDPVRANAESGDPGLPKHIADLFPANFQDSPLGPIPSGWNVQPIGDVARCVGGGTPSTKEPTYWDGPIPFATPKDMASLAASALLETERGITKAGLAQISSGLLPKGTVLLSSRAPIGYLAIAETRVAVNQGFIAMICDGSLPNHYLLQWARANMETIIGNANGTTFLEISKKNFRPISVVVPPPEVLQAFVHLAEPLHQQVVTNLGESRTLANIRDALLPKLLSGEIRLEATRLALEAVH